MVTDVVEESSITWTKNPDYWGYDEKYPQNRLPYVDQLRRLVIPEEGSMMAALRSGKLDFRMFAPSDIDSLESLQRTNPEIGVHPIYFRSSDSFAPNHRVPPFDDINVRRALQMALDNEDRCGYVLEGLGRSDTSRAGRVARGISSPSRNGTKRSSNTTGMTRKLPRSSLMRLGIRAAPTALDSRPP